MLELALAVAVFLASHRLTNRPAFRAGAERALGGRTGFIAAYSLLSLALLAWIIVAYQRAPTIVLWHQQPWMRWVPVLAMAPACLLLGAGMATPNPFSIGPGGKGFDPARPGLLRLTRHPVLWGLAIWAGAHLVPNGDAAAALVFVPLLTLALAGPRLLDAARRRALADWDGLAALTGRPAWVMVPETGWRWLIGIALYAALIHLHLPVIGASPWP
ncbi:NnrU family protein [Magnetospirillum sp. UT-4]|uniref:NnrU family protein n=1 Tax=Magnetospirillum sp. UT-4 TaxID=2681467 RepID=UPI0013834C1C|nr:NnrU family protein [Magnetospirillum sp. UT-4]CAA7619223.1 NnrU family protein [Magnetospirillum sp. UT-4]